MRGFAWRKTAHFTYKKEQKKTCCLIFNRFIENSDRSIAIAYGFILVIVSTELLMMMILLYANNDVRFSDYFFINQEISLNAKIQMIFGIFFGFGLVAFIMNAFIFSFSNNFEANDEWSISVFYIIVYLGVLPQIFYCCVSLSATYWVHKKLSTFLGFLDLNGQLNLSSEKLVIPETNPSLKFSLRSASSNVKTQLQFDDRNNSILCDSPTTENRTSLRLSNISNMSNLQLAPATGVGIGKGVAPPDLANALSNSVDAVIVESPNGGVNTNNKKNIDSNTNNNNNNNGLESSGESPRKMALSSKHLTSNSVSLSGTLNSDKTDKTDKRDKRDKREKKSRSPQMSPSGNGNGNKSASFGPDNSKSHSHSLSSLVLDEMNDDVVLLNNGDDLSSSTPRMNRISVHSIGSTNSSNHTSLDENSSGNNSHNDEIDDEKDGNQRVKNKKSHKRNSKHKHKHKARRRARLSDILTNEGAFDLFIGHLSKEFSIEIMIAFVEFTQYELFVLNNLQCLKDSQKELNDLLKGTFYSNIPQSGIIDSIGNNQTSGSQSILINTGSNSSDDDSNNNNTNNTNNTNNIDNNNNGELRNNTVTPQGTGNNDKRMFKKIREISYELYKKYVAVGASYEINVSSRMRKRIILTIGDQNEWLKDDILMYKQDNTIDEQDLYEKSCQMAVLFNDCRMELHKLLRFSFSRFVLNKTEFAKVYTILKRQRSKKKH